MFQKIKKRDGRIVKFDSNKITKAIAGAGLATGEFDKKTAQKLTLQVLNLAQQAITHKVPLVEEIQDVVEEILLSSSYRRTAKAYILYREQHTQLRAMKDKMSVDLVEQYLSREDWQVKENSNMTFSLQGLNNYLASEVSKTYWLRKIYSPEIREAYEKGDFHIHDLGTLAVYTYYGKETVIAKVKGLIKLTSFEKLYDEIDSKEKLLNQQEGVFAKYPDDVYALDNDGWTMVKRVTRKTKNRKMRFIKNRGGRSVIVTDNHPMITEKGEKIAETVALEDKLLTVDLNSLLQKERLFYIDEIDLLKEIKAKKDNWRGSKVYFDGISIENVPRGEEKKGILHTVKFAMPRKIKLTGKFGYFVGFALAEGYLSYDRQSSRTMSLSQKDKRLLVKANEGLLDNNISGCLTKNKSQYELEIKNPFLKFLFQEVFKIKTGAKNKTLPIDTLLYNKKFVKGMLAGLIDGDGSIETSRTLISLRIASRAMLEQCSTVLSLFGFTPRDRDIEGEGTVRFYNGRKIIQNYPLYGISFRKIKEGLPSEKYREAKISKKAWHDEARGSWHIVLNNKLVNIPDKVIYDVTTESGTLIVNGMWNHNCVGWDLQDLLLQGFQGVAGKTESKPANHFRTALGQVVNFFYTLQGEAAGAQAFSSFDTLLSPFIRADNLNYAGVKQALQEFVFNMNVPTRVGFQCLSEDTKILTPNGWKSYDELQEGDIIYTFNTETGQLEKKATDSIFRRKYRGKMFNLRNRNQDQLISPRHRVVRQVFNIDKYKLEPIEDILKLKSPISIPIGGENTNSDFPIDDHQLMFLAWTLSEGTIEKDGSHRVSIYQSPKAHPENYKEIIGLFDYFDFQYTENSQTGLGTCTQVRALPASSKIIHQWLGATSKKIPSFLFNLSKRQARIFLETYIKGDGWEEKYRKRIVTTDTKILEGLQGLAVLAGFNFIARTRKPEGISKKVQYILTLTESKHDYIQSIKKVDYEGIIWSVHTDNETVIAKRKGQVFITGNTPYTNITLDIHPSPVYKNQPVIVGGKLQKETYGDFQEEMDMFNQAFLEVMLAGDAKSRVFTFPIPTYNIDKNFDWDDPKLNYLWESTAKFGLPYFANFVNSDMKPEDVRSMCPLDGNEKVLIQSSRGRNLEYSTIRNVYEGNSKQGEYKIFSDGKFVKGRFNKFDNQEMIKIKLGNGHVIKMSKHHLNFVLTNKNSKIKELKGSELREGMYLPYSLKEYQGSGGTEDIGYFVGAYAGDGSFDGDTAVVFSLSRGQKETVADRLIKISEKYFGSHWKLKEYDDTDLLTLKIYSRAAVGLSKDFVQGMKRDKYYRANLFNMSQEFRKGVIQGHYDTDGGNRNRIYTSSEKMVETLNMLAATLGTTTSIYKDEREGRLGIEPNYSVLIYQLNRRNYGDFWFKKDDKLWMQIKTIEKIPNVTAYCFEVESGEPVFTVGSTGLLTHNCRLRLDLRELRKKGGGYFGSDPLTGSIGVVTINLPHLGYLAKNENDFLKGLGKLMMLAKNSLETKRKVLERSTDDNLYPYSKFYLRETKKRFDVYWKNHFSTIGLIGMNEATLNLLGKNLGEPKAKAFAVKVLDFMRDKLLEFQKETGNNYNLEATPAEGTAYRLALKDKKQFPDIICANEKEYQKGAEPFYTNSTQLPVNYSDDIFEVLDLQDEIQQKYSGGCIEKGNQVLTNKGLLNIEYIVNNFGALKPIKVLSYNPKKEIAEWDKIIEAVSINVAKHDKIRIKGERNLNIITSDWHPFFVLEKIKLGSTCPICGKEINNIKAFATHLRWNQECRKKYQSLPKNHIVERRADELEFGDYILQNSYNLYPEKEAKLSDNLMYLIGFFVGDGSISKFIDNRGGNNLERYKVRFFSEHQEALEKIAKILKSFDSYVKVISNDKRSELLREISTSKKEVAEFLFKYGFKSGKKVYNVSISQRIKKNITKRNVFSLLAGLMDSDGHLSKGGGDFEYYTVSEELAEDILEICSTAGIMVSKIKKLTRRKNEVDIWRLRIPAHEMTRLKEQLTNTIHRERIKENLSNRKKRHFPVVRVKELSRVNVGDNQFYDLMTEKNHNYLAGKSCLVFVHNTVLHIFAGERVQNREVIKQLVKKVCENYHLPYFTFSPTFSICPVHGYLSGSQAVCPKCGAVTEVYSRPVGYLRPVSQWNKGKAEEFKERKTFKVE